MARRQEVAHHETKNQKGEACSTESEARSARPRTGQGHGAGQPAVELLSAAVVFRHFNNAPSQRERVEERAGSEWAEVKILGVSE